MENTGTLPRLPAPEDPDLKKGSLPVSVNPKKNFSLAEKIVNPSEGLDLEFQVPDHVFLHHSYGIDHAPDQLCLLVIGQVILLSESPGTVDFACPVHASRCFLLVLCWCRLAGQIGFIEAGWHSPRCVFQIP